MDDTLNPMRILLFLFCCVYSLAAQALPQVLSVADRALYQQLFAAKTTAKLKELSPQLENPLLIGHVLGEFYQTHQPESAEKLAAWLKKYPDHPQAPSLYRQGKH